MIEKVLRDILLSDATISGLVGTRVYTDLGPIDESLPMIVITRQGAERIEMHAGQNLAEYRLDITCISNDAAQVATLTNRLQCMLHYYSPNVSTPTLKRVRIENDITFYEPETEVFHGVVSVASSATIS